MMLPLFFIGTIVWAVINIVPSLASEAEAMTNLMIVARERTGPLMCGIGVILGEENVGTGTAPGTGLC